MAFTADDLTAIDTAIKSGHRKVKYRDREVEYRSLDEMKAVRDLIRDELGERSSFEDRGRYVEFDRDLDS